jgi:glutaredoxin 3
MFCEQVEGFLSQRGVHYTLRDVTTDQEAVAELEKLGYLTTPVIVIDGEVVVGFDRERLEHLLGE